MSRPKSGRAKPGRSKEAKAPRLTAAEARAEAQARAAAGRESLDAAIAGHFGDGPAPGAAERQAAVVSTAVFTAVTVLGVVVDSRVSRYAVIVVDLGLFALGCVAFLAALYLGAQRSRESDMTMAGWWFLSGSAPTSVRSTLLGALAVQTVVAFAGAAARPFTALAFGILVPTLAVALCGLWGARHGYFPQRR